MRPARTSPPTVPWPRDSASSEDLHRTPEAGAAAPAELPRRFDEDVPADHRLEPSKHRSHRAPRPRRAEAAEIELMNGDALDVERGEERPSLPLAVEL